MAVVSLPLTLPSSNVLFFLLHHTRQPSLRSLVIPEHIFLPPSHKAPGRRSRMMEIATEIAKGVAFC